MKIRQLQRDPGPADVAALMPLCEQLGHPVSPSELAERLADVLADARQALFVCEDDAGALVGWIHAQPRPSLIHPPVVEITALVVDRRSHRRGFGRALLERAERWAREQGYRTVMLRSAIGREDAHRFYARLGYEMTSTSLKFTKQP
jgi:GNAT superfamily N-acetyltransferase